MNILKQKIFAGAYKEWTESFSSYPATDYDFKYVLRKGTSSAVTLNAEASGSDFILKSLTTSFTVQGDYNFQAIATSKGDETKVYVIGSGKIYVYPNLATASDPRCNERVNADLIETAMQNWNGEFADVNLNGKSVRYREWSELVKAFNFWNSRALVKEGRKTNKSNTKQVRFFIQ